jgi:hypothetical protein
MKNIFTLFALAFIFAVIFISCKKETVTNTVYIKDTSIINTTVIRDSTTTTDSTLIRDSVYPSSIIGFWPGTFNNPGFDPSYEFSFLFKSDGTLRVYIEGSDADTAAAPFKGDGVYRILGLALATQFNVAGQLYSTQGTLDSSFLFYQGTIGEGLQTSGTFVNIAHKQ